MAMTAATTPNLAPFILAPLLFKDSNQVFRHTIEVTFICAGYGDKKTIHHRLAGHQALNDIITYADPSNKVNKKMIPAAALKTLDLHCDTDI